MLEELMDKVCDLGIYEVRLNKGELTDSLVIDFESKDRLGRFTVWDDRSCMAEIIDVESGSYIINERKEFQDDYCVFEEFKKFDSLLSHL